jgi:hypothetical protein
MWLSKLASVKDCGTFHVGGMAVAIVSSSWSR